MKIKICGIKTLDEIKIINEFLPDYIGFIFAKSKREIDFKKALELKQNLNEKIKAVGVFVDSKIENILNFYNEKIIDIAQLHGEYSEDEIEELKNKGLDVIKVIKVKENFYNIKTKADFILFDTYSPIQAGGLNKTFNWNIKINSNVPYFIAGGINEGNVLEMRKKLNPYGVDISSGVEENGFKTKEKVSNIIKIVRGKNL